MIPIQGRERGACVHRSETLFILISTYDFVMGRLVELAVWRTSALRAELAFNPLRCTLVKECAFDVFAAYLVALAGHTKWRVHY